MGLIALGSLAASGQAMAACPGKQPVKPELLEGHTLCTARGKDAWQEYHEPGGRLIDYKMGPNDKVDPTKQVGTWSARGERVVYTFGSSTSNYRVFENGGASYCMEGSDGDFSVTFRKGLSKCAGTAPVALARGDQRSDDRGRDDRGRGRDDRPGPRF
ncbi:hypothetical protein CCZ27_14030 [Thauera sinica]|nr:hypothetical protein CCZ27_14030 [Thauera sp. K11]